MRARQPTATAARLACRCDPADHDRTSRSRQKGTPVMTPDTTPLPGAPIRHCTRPVAASDRRLGRLAAAGLLALVLGILPAGAASAGAARVIDGDTIEMDGTVYRIEGIDAPEFGQTCGGAGGDWPCGKVAVEAMAALVSGRDVSCRGLSQDIYGRTIATCRTGPTDIGAEMVRAGHAWAFRRYSESYVRQEAEARAQGRGIWQGPAVPAWDYRAERWAEAKGRAPKGCPIKGNISANGKIYHPPWSPWYDRTKINEARGERWFCTEAEALAAGWRAPRWH